ncbi:MAG: hypothetical protein EKK47_09290 [Burkholderiales bacterium]|nr:MAG: hypothetical protein EKK47_09290 [Burkholderiales bacterium]
MASRSPLASSFQAPSPGNTPPWLKNAVALLLLALLVPALSWWVWHAIPAWLGDASRPASGAGTPPLVNSPAQDNVAQRANAVIEATPPRAGLPSAPSPSGTPALTPDKPSETASSPDTLAQAHAPSPAAKNTLSIKGLGFITIDEPDKSAPRQKDVAESKARTSSKPSEHAATSSKGSDPCQDINRKLSTQDPTPEDIAFLKRGCK